VKTKDLKDKIGAIICECCEENDTCNVYICEYLTRLENHIASLVKKLKKDIIKQDNHSE
jgi:hypothetical protein